MELFTGNAWPFRLGVSLRHEIAMSEWARAIAEWYCKNSAGFWGRSVHMEFLHTIYWVYTECQMKMKWRIYMTICFSRLSLSLTHTVHTHTFTHKHRAHWDQYRTVRVQNLSKTPSLEYIVNKYSQYCEWKLLYHPHSILALCSQKKTKFRRTSQQLFSRLVGNRNVV